MAGFNYINMGLFFSVVLTLLLILLLLMKHRPPHTHTPPQVWLLQYGKHNSQRECLMFFPVNEAHLRRSGDEDNVAAEVDWPSLVYISYAHTNTHIKHTCRPKPLSICTTKTPHSQRGLLQIMFICSYYALVIQVGSGVMFIWSNEKRWWIGLQELALSVQFYSKHVCKF